MKVPYINQLTVNSKHLGEPFIRKRYPEFHVWLIDKYKHIHYKHFSELLYLYYNGLEERPVCKCCNSEVNYINFVRGYRTYCSIRCRSNDPDLKEKQINTCNERFGVDNPFQNEVIKEKIKQTNLKKYEVENPMQSDVIREKSRKTCLEKYGVEYYSQTDGCKEKTKRTNLKKYGGESPLQSDVIKEKIKQTNLKKYGVENPIQSDVVKDKIKWTNLERYGSEHASQSDVVKDKIKRTNLERYGVEYYSQSTTYKKRLSDINQKSYNTKKANGTFNTSSIEIQFESWLKQNNINYIRQYKSDKYPFNCDFYFPDRDLYLEIQGHWSHGGHPFDPTNDIKTLNEWKSKGTKYYDNVIDVWTVRDPMKRKVARENGLNWCEVFTDNLNDLIKQFESPLKKSF